MLPRSDCLSHVCIGSSQLLTTQQAFTMPAARPFALFTAPRQINVCIQRNSPILVLAVKRARGFENFDKVSGYRKLTIRARVLSSAGQDAMTGGRASVQLGCCV